jgi:anthranilate synthase/aminodeoxychorismate synthase-like glutamine amidotransferase
MNADVLLLDNFDSFTFNLAHALAVLGASVTVARPDSPQIAALLAGPPRALVISPGPSRPETAKVAVAAVRALHGRAPILGVCLGHQAIAVALGGSVVRAPKAVHGCAARVAHDGGAEFAGVPRLFRAGRYHSLVVDPEALPAGFVVSARSSDGLVMAMRHREYPTFGVQFHPESILTKEGPAMLRNFLALAGAPI